MPAIGCWSRKTPCRRLDWSPMRSATARGVQRVGVGPEVGDGLLALPSAPRRPRRPARFSVPASLSSRARPSAKTQRARPPRGFGDCFSSGLRRPPCMRWTTKVAGSKTSARYLPR